MSTVIFCVLLFGNVKLVTSDNMKDVLTNEIWNWNCQNWVIVISKTIHSSFRLFFDKYVVAYCLVGEQVKKKKKIIIAIAPFVIKWDEEKVRNIFSIFFVGAVFQRDVVASENEESDWSQVNY